MILNIDMMDGRMCNISLDIDNQNKEEDSKASGFFFFDLCKESSSEFGGGVDVDQVLVTQHDA
jgi:hypothetical protein